MTTGNGHAVRTLSPTECFDLLGPGSGQVSFEADCLDEAPQPG